MNMTIAAMFLKSFRHFRDRECVVEGEKRLTYGEIERRVHRLATVFQSRGLQKENRVAILSANRQECIELEVAVRMR
ncbi:acyl-CoA synthetase (AMP-forming)/AMP-acid ligase II [Caldalkalibacillus uzonensis]|uniref:Acyl-CoA synthetase (AMP-forming)/AMP-acid ligase II n=1 Tax=Caldalkalibacillus uzonensis TaxID=353224 RepID=A0ABU0CU39_9BACI|nr:AMP-binding protein [Caldalkalibacillus uzonensis]MDQ0339937.1 acyl-CoA synthetase (AMP-forming)/AMP-acid ligase II [Caldalkalibacillus uzonensis]